jgi:hypothetical protein
MTAGLERVWRQLTLERGIVTGLVIGCAGFALAIRSVELWFGAQLGALDPTMMMRYAIPSVTLMIAGAEVMFASFVFNFIEPLGSRLRPRP